MWRPLVVCISMLLLMQLSVFAQQSSMLKGRVVTRENALTSPITGANVYTIPSLNGTTTDSLGRFQLNSISVEDQFLVISFVGYVNDTLVLDSIEQNSTLFLKKRVELSEVEVVKKQKSTQIAYLDPIKKETLSRVELQKAACCNLSESFETSPSVDVAFTDAVTGTRQIRMLGLSGPNIQLLRENIPGARGIAAVNGLSYTPGPWIERIQLNKGTGSVVNGYESIAGQINVSLLSPETADKFFFNAYTNQGLRNELNGIWKPTLKNKRWSTALFSHVVFHPKEFDNNGDGFSDNNSGKGGMFLNRWKYTGANGWRMQFGLKGLFHDKESGQIERRIEEQSSADLWRYIHQSRRIDGWAKLGKVSASFPWRSLGIQLASSIEQQTHLFDTRDYQAMQQSAYVNTIYASIIGNTNHTIKTGLSMQYDWYEEQLDSLPFNRLEWVPGAFGEYAFSRTEKFNLVLGLRADVHNQYGSFITPRLHVRYAPKPAHVFRLSGGRGQRTPQLLAENLGVLASNRTISLLTNNTHSYYLGIQPEIAWNAGASYTYSFKLGYRDAVLTIDAFTTRYQNQLVVDLDANPQEVRFYNLEGKSLANAVQIQFDYELLPRLDVRMAYRYNKVLTQYGELLLSKPLLAEHRSFVNLAYETMKYWKYDVTVNWQGKQRIPSTLANPAAFQRPLSSSAYFLVNAQVTKSWNKLFDVYVGVENALNFQQKDAIIQPENPDGKFFDSSLIWGPVFGRNVYLGLRYTLK